MKALSISPQELYRFAISLGYKHVLEAEKDGLFVLNSQGGTYRQLIFPINRFDPNFEEMLDISLSKLAKNLDIQIEHLITLLSESNDDILSVRYFSESAELDTLQLDEAIDALNATKQLILSAACSLDHPQLYYPKLSRNKVDSFFSKVRLRHTQHGSFVIRVSNPLQSQPHATYLKQSSSSDALFGRESFERVEDATSEIVDHLQKNNLETLYLRQKKMSKPIISYNFLNALVEMQHVHLDPLLQDTNFMHGIEMPDKTPFELSIQWSDIIPKPAKNTNQPIRLLPSYHDGLLRMRDYFPNGNPSERGEFNGTVEHLEGKANITGEREGEVQLKLKVGKRNLLVRAVLNPTFYKRAYEAHGTKGAKVKVAGVLRAGKRLRLLDDITKFELE